MAYSWEIFEAWAAFTGGNFVLWKSEVAEMANEIKIKNRVQLDTESWTARRILGEPPCNTLALVIFFLWLPGSGPPSMLGCLEGTAPWVGLLRCTN